MPSLKQIQINKDLKIIMLWAGSATFIVLFCLISIYSMSKVFNYQNQVLLDNNKALSILKNDQSAENNLVKSYQNFNNSPTNIIGGVSSSDTQNNGNNTKIILDALPSALDYPALLSSVQSLLGSEGVTINSITGAGNQSSSSTTNSNSSTPQSLTFSFSVSGPYSNIQNVISTFERSIRPMQFQSIDLSGNQSSMNLTATVQTYYQPMVGFNVSTENLE
jgi:Tfp pilus assembly protein PilO